MTWGRHFKSCKLHHANPSYIFFQVNEQSATGHFVLNQDTGGAIRGADHVDLFTGNGELSELVAGSIKQKGALFFLLKK